MAHARTIIRAKFIELLHGNTVAGDKVFDSRIYNIEQHSLPAIIVFSEHEEITTETISYPRTQNRMLRVNVECYIKNKDHLSTKIDDLTLSVECLLQASINLEDTCKDCRLETIDINFNIDGEKPVAVASLIFTVFIQTKENNPAIII